MYTVTLKVASHELKRRIGSKALQLAKLTDKNIRIPDGFIITSDALDRFLFDNGLQQNDTMADIGERFTRASIPDEVQKEVAAAFELLQDGGLDAGSAVAVRSSSSAEDLEEASFAGQYETFLNVTNVSDLLVSLKQCWASLFSAQVREYAMKKNVDWGTEIPPMGVLVQQMVQADVSGVVFSTNPVTQNEEEVVINASYGLGEGIVSGLVTPDTYFVSKTDGCVHKKLGEKETKIVAFGDGTKEVITTDEERNRYCLTDGQIAALVEETRNLEMVFGCPLDIEFALKDGLIYILQARPITA